MRIDSLNVEVGKSAHGEDLLRGVLRGHAEPPHAGVDGDGAADAPVLPHRLGADHPRHFQIVERTDDAVLHRRSDLVGQQIAEDLDRQSERGKFERLVDFGNAEGVRPGGFHHLGHRQHTEAVGIRLEHRHQPAGGDPPPDLHEILRQSIQINFEIDATFLAHFSLKTDLPEQMLKHNISREPAETSRQTRAGS